MSGGSNGLCCIHTNQISFQTGLCYVHTSTPILSYDAKYSNLPFNWELYGVNTQ